VFTLSPSKVKEILPLSLLLVFVGCVDLSEVGRFAALSRNAKTAFPALVADIQNSCERRADYAPERAREDVLLHCKNLGTSRKGLLEAQRVLLDYMDALKKLSSDSTFDYGKTLDTLPDSLAKSGLDSGQVTATTGLAKMIADAAIAGYRRKEIGKLVGETNEDVQVLTAALKRVITEGYGNELNLEKEAMNAFYETNIKEFGKQEPLSVILVKRNWANDLAEVQKKNDAAVAYGKVMDSIGRGHQKLYDSRNRWSNKTLVKELSPEISNLDESTLEVSKAFQ
jgi:hypothetical protein